MLLQFKKIRIIKSVMTASPNGFRILQRFSFSSAGSDHVGKIRELEEFYRRELLAGAAVIPAIPDLKIPKYNDLQNINHKITSPKMVLAAMEETNLTPMLWWKDLKGDRSVVIDFDFHKLEDKVIVEKIKNKLMALIIDRDWTAVSTPSGGIHIYFRVPSDHLCHSRVILQGLTRSFIPFTDWLGKDHKVMGPNGTNRQILNLTQGNLKEIPWFLMPMRENTKENNKFIDFLTETPTKYWLQGFRASGMLKIMREFPSISNSQLEEYNQIFCCPPKTAMDMEISVFKRRPNIKKDILEFQDPLDVGVVFDVDTASYFVREEEGLYWEKKDIRSAGRRLIRLGIPLEGNRLDNYIDRALSEENIFKIRENAEMSLPKNCFPLYFKNRALFLIKKENGSFELQEIPSTFLKDNYILASLSQIEFNLSLQEQKTFLEKLSTQHNQSASLYSIVKDLCPETFSFIEEKTVFKSLELKKAVTTFLVNLIALVFLKNVKNYNKELFCKKIVVLTGNGDSGKSTYINYLSGFAGETLVAVSDIHRLANGKFEASRFYRTVVNLFPDQDESYGGRAKSLLGKLFSGMMKAISGGDRISSEKKFKDLGDLKNTGITIVSTNAFMTLASATANAYGAMKSRLANVSMENSGVSLKASSNYENVLFAINGAKLCMILASFEKERFNIVKTIKDYDFETLIYKFKESPLYTNKTCTYFGFASQLLNPREGSRTITMDLPIMDLFGIFVQYSIYREGSLIQRYPHFIKKSIRKAFESVHLDPIDNLYLKRIWDKEFIVHEDINEASASQESVFIAKLNSRCERIIGSQMLKPEIATVQRQARLENGQFGGSFEADIIVLKSVTLDLDFLETLPNLVLPEYFKDSLGSVLLKPTLEPKKENLSVDSIQKPKEIKVLNERKIRKNTEAEPSKALVHPTLEGYFIYFEQQLNKNKKNHNLKKEFDWFYGLNLEERKSLIEGHYNFYRTRPKGDWPLEENELLNWMLDFNICTK